MLEIYSDICQYDLMYGGRTLNIKLWNLDGTEEDVIFSITCNGQSRLISKAELVTLLGLSSDSVNSAARDGSRTLASIGKVIGIIKRDRFDALTQDDCQRIIATMRSYDGDLSRKRSSQAGRWLREISGWKTASADLKSEIDKFLSRYPALEAIPKRKP